MFTFSDYNSLRCLVSAKTSLKWFDTLEICRSWCLKYAKCRKILYPPSRQKVALNSKCLILSAELCISRIHFTVEPPFNVPQFKVFPPFYVQFQWSEVSHLSVKFPSFKILSSWVFKFTAPQRNIKWGFQFNIIHQFMLRCTQDSLPFKFSEIFLYVLYTSTFASMCISGHWLVLCSNYHIWYRSPWSNKMYLFWNTFWAHNFFLWHWMVHVATFVIPWILCTSYTDHFLDLRFSH
jgi:hypothetical protein